MYDQLIKLVKVTKGDDDYGDTPKSIIEREVYAELKSIGQSEFYKAKAVGLKPELKLELPDYMDYQGEKIVKYKEEETTEEKTYSVIRTFRFGNKLEIVCKEGEE